MLCLAPFGIPTDRPAAQQKPHGASHVVAPTSRYNPSGPASPSSARVPYGRRAFRLSRGSVVLPDAGFTEQPRRDHLDPPRKTLDHRAFRQLSWSSSPLRRMSSGESTSPRLASPGTFRPQGFSPSRRFAPRPSARPCFMPVTPLGFCSSGIFPHSQVLRLPPRDYPLGVSPHITCRILLQCAASGSAGPHGRRPNHSSPTGLCSGCESVPTGGVLPPTPSGRFPPELFVASPGFCPVPMAAPRATRSLMRFAISATHEPAEQAQRATDRRSGCAPATSPPGSGSHSLEQDIPS